MEITTSKEIDPNDVVDHRTDADKIKKTDNIQQPYSYGRTQHSRCATKKIQLLNSPVLSMSKHS